MKREDIKLGIVVRFRNRTWSVVSIKEYIDGGVYADVITSGDSAKNIPIEKLEEHPLSKGCEDNTQKGKFFKIHDDIIENIRKNRPSELKFTPYPKKDFSNKTIEISVYNYHIGPNCTMNCIAKPQLAQTEATQGCTAFLRSEVLVTLSISVEIGVSKFKK